MVWKNIDKVPIIFWLYRYSFKHRYFDTNPGLQTVYRLMVHSIVGELDLQLDIHGVSLSCLSASKTGGRLSLSLSLYLSLLLHPTPNILFLQGRSPVIFTTVLILLIASGLVITCKLRPPDTQPSSQTLLHSLHPGSC